MSSLCHHTHDFDTQQNLMSTKALQDTFTVMVLKIIHRQKYDKTLFVQQERRNALIALTTVGECNMSEKKPETKETKKKIERSDTEKEARAIRDSLASSLFLEFLPHYWDIADDLPAYIKLKLVLNGFTSIWNACTVLCNDISDRKLRMQMDGMLRHMQTWHEMPSIT